jgi:hypothetical protein
LTTKLIVRVVARIKPRGDGTAALARVLLVAELTVSCEATRLVHCLHRRRCS